MDHALDPAERRQRRGHATLRGSGPALASAWPARARRPATARPGRDRPAGRPGRWRPRRPPPCPTGPAPTAGPRTRTATVGRPARVRRVRSAPTSRGGLRKLGARRPSPRAACARTLAARAKRVVVAGSIAPIIATGCVRVGARGRARPRVERAPTRRSSSGTRHEVAARAPRAPRQPDRAARPAPAGRWPRRAAGRPQRSAAPSHPLRTVPAMADLASGPGYNPAQQAVIALLGRPERVADVPGRAGDRAARRDGGGARAGHPPPDLGRPLVGQQARAHDHPRLRGAPRRVGSGALRVDRARGPRAPSPTRPSS